MVLLISPRATLGQRKSLINSITPISKHQLSGKPHKNATQANKTQHTKAALRPEWTGRWVSFGAPSRTLRIRRTRMPVGRTSPSTRLGEGSNAQRTSPHGDGDSNRDVARLRSGCLSSGPYNVSVSTTPIPADGPGSRPRLGEPIVRHSSCCLRRRPRRQPTYLGSRSRPAGRRSTLRSPGNSELEPQFPADSGTALTTRSSTSPNKSLRLSALYLSAHCRTLSQHAEHMRRLHTLFVARLFYSCLTLQQTCVLNAV